MIKKSQSPKRPAPTNYRRNSTIGNRTAAQRKRVLEVLRSTPAGATTIELRELHDIMMPAARIHELRWRLRLNIQRIWDAAVNAQGNRHRVARYVLLQGLWEDNA